jgi:hypothetical protein
MFKQPWATRFVEKIQAWLLPANPGHSPLSVACRGVFLAFLIWYGWPMLTATMKELGDSSFFVHLIHLPFHEAGHVIFGLLGNQLLHSLGGTLGQLLMPLGLLLAFRLRNKDAFGAAVALWLFGQSLVDCAPYINDARVLRLTLITGFTGREAEGHDWEQILTSLGWLHRDVYIARDVLFAGRLVMVGAYVWGLVALVDQYRRWKAAQRSEAPGGPLPS